MIRSITYKLSFFIVLLVCTQGLNAQDQNGYAANLETDKRVGDYLDLLQQGYSEEEIFQDLGNANLLAENYEAAAFWYEKLLQLNDHKSFNDSYRERYSYAMAKLQNKNAKQVMKKNWAAYIKADYMPGKGRFDQQLAPKKAIPQTTLATNQSKQSNLLPANEGYAPAMAVTKDGRIAYFSKAVYKKPLTGIFSKKQLVHEIYRAENIGGKWTNVQKVTVCPEYFSAKHPTVSEDGKRLFFASNMPGSYGEYDIYVADIKPDGSFGIAKNLGPKVNTKKDELYPTLFNGTLLFFASEGREGYGGLDLYASQVTHNSLTNSVNLGSHINSNRDDYAIELKPEKGLGYVVSNRGGNNQVAQHTISYGDRTDNTLMANRDEKLIQMLNDESSMEYSNTVFDNE